LVKVKYFQDQIIFYEECAVSLPEELEINFNVLSTLLQDLSALEFKQMMKDPIDDSPAILSINAGAGGLEAANWVTILLRMYSRYADSYKFKIELLDMKPSEENGGICTDSVSIRIDGPYAFGFLKGESGVHRLIRNSPFNAGDARHTSFAAVAVLPDIEDTIDIKIDEKDIEITSQTAGGPGGQNVNRVQSAIRIKHIPTGINVLARTERDQLANKKMAFKILKAKLYEIELKKKEEQQKDKMSTMLDNAFGSQIRTYTDSKYSLVKDHRTEYEVNNFNKVLDGDLDGFIMSFLRL
jgi:peptide chain release factor 2